jgi:hypothetical protein
MMCLTIFVPMFWHCYVTFLVLHSLIVLSVLFFYVFKDENPEVVDERLQSVLPVSEVFQILSSMTLRT